MGPRKSARLLVSALAALTLLAASCATGDDTGSESPNEPIIVGGTLGLSGDYATSSAAYKAAYDFWVNKVNSEGGLLGRKVKLIIYDDESNPTTAQQLYQRLINEDGADLLLAPYSTQVGGAIVPITERAGKVLWDGGFVSQELHARNKMIVTSWPYQDHQYGRPLFEYFKTLPAGERPKSLALVTAQNPFTLVVRTGYEGKEGVLNYAKQAGMRVVFDEEYDQKATDVTGLIQKAKATNPDVFIALSLPNDGALIAKTVHQQKFQPDFYCSCGSQVTTLPTWRDLGEAGNNVMSTTTAWPTQDNPGLEELAQHLEEKLDYQEMPAYGAGGLAILQVMEQAVEGTASLDQTRLRNYLNGRTFDTAVGELRYNPDGTLAFGALLTQFQDDHNEIIWPEEEATGKARVPLR
ncbi:MAG: ABC transporter substrate-binding protein [Streptosporangiales bacterium]|nr:ABC transporter substrate-binding protein [Streptosporangiales bacterium]